MAGNQKDEKSNTEKEKKKQKNKSKNAEKESKKEEKQKKPQNASALSDQDTEDYSTEYDDLSSEDSGSGDESIGKTAGSLSSSSASIKPDGGSQSPSINGGSQLLGLEPNVTGSLSSSSASIKPDGGSQFSSINGGSQPLLLEPNVSFLPSAAKTGSRQGEGGSQPPARKFTELLREARNLDSGAGGELSGEPGEGFVNKMAEILPKGYHLDLGCATGVYLVLIKEKRPDLELAGVEIQRIRCNMAEQLHALAGFKTQIRLADILDLDCISETISSVFMHDTVWTQDVVDASTKLVLENASLEMVVTVQERPRLITEGSFAVDQTFDFTLHGGKRHSKALVYKRTRSTNVHQVRKRVTDVTRSFFARDIESYRGGTEAQQKADMEVRYPFVQY